MQESKEKEKHIKIYCDGGARGNPGKGACAFVVLKEGKVVIHEESKFLGNTTNNIAEYNGVILALNWLKSNDRYSDVDFYLDSQLVVNQINGVFKIKNKNLQECRILISNLEKSINGNINYHYIPREMNSVPDKLLNNNLDENL